jgi:hypothetical protein
MYEFYMEQSSVDFDYIFLLKSKHSPQGSGLNVCSCYSKQNCNGLLRIFLHNRDYRERGWRQQGRHFISKLQKTHFISVETLDVPPPHTQLYIPPAALIAYFRNIRWITFTCLSLITHSQTFKVRSALPEFRVEADWLKCAAPRM